MGPPTVVRDRFDYVTAISESWKRQMLLNLLKVRYADAPVFMDVTSVISAYSLGADISVGGEVARPGRGDAFAGAGAGSPIRGQADDHLPATLRRQGLRGA